MKTIGKKKENIQFIYVMIFLIACILMIFALKSPKSISSSIMIVTGLFLAIYAMWIFIDIIKTPKIVIEYNERDSTVIIKKNIIISISSIKDVSYVKARSKGITYGWGKIIIETNNVKYQCNYVENCEQVAKMLTKLMYKVEI